MRVRLPTAPDDSAIGRLIARGAAAHPGVPEPPGLRERLSARLAQGTAEADVRAADLYLAAACIAGDAAAIARLDLELPATVRAVVARLGRPSEHDEVAQRVRVELLVRDAAGRCGLARYSGRGELRSYLRTVAVRVALRQLERTPRPASHDHGELLALVPDARDSPELNLLKQRCRDGVRAGFAAGLAALSPHERTLLRQHYVDGLSIDILGRIHRVHRATCARWVEAARVKILRGIRRHLRALGLDAADLDIAVALVQSQLDLSLSRQLASQD